MSRRDDGLGGWVLCCNGIGYWLNQEPLKTDQWLGMPRAIKMASDEGVGYQTMYFYKTAKWPVGLSPVIRGKIRHIPIT